MVGSSSAAASLRVSRAVRVAAALHVFLGLAFGASVPFVLAHLARHGELPMSPLGWRYMAGPFEQLGPEPFTALGWALVGVSALDVVAGSWLWQGRRRGLKLGLATNAPAFVLGAGFDAAPRRRADPGGPGIGGASEPPMRGLAQPQAPA